MVGNGIPEWAAALRSELPSVQAQAYLNTGTAGPMPERVAEAMRTELAWELEHGRSNVARWDRLHGLRERARTLGAELLGAEPAEVALTHHTSDGINIVLWGLDWQPGDAVVTTSLEHDAVMVPLALLRDRRGVELRVAEIGRGERLVEGLEAVLDDRVRLVVVSHIAWSTGAVLPMPEVVERARAVGAHVLVDGAQAAGVLPLDVGSLGADYYTVSGQKWLCGPEGTGALFVRHERIDGLLPTFASFFTAARHDYRGAVTLHDTAKRYEVGMMFRPSLAGFGASLEWSLRQVGVGRAWTRSLELAAELGTALADLPGVEIVTPVGQASPLVAFDLVGWSPAHLHTLAVRLGESGVLVRSIDTPPYALRASLGYFNTAEDLSRLCDELERALAAGPEALTVEGWAARLPRQR